MKINCEGIAIICHKDTKQEFSIEADELEWEVIGSSERGMELETQYGATVRHDQLGELKWLLVEYPVGSQNQAVTNVGEHVLLEDFDYSLDHEKEIFDGEDFAVPASELKKQFLKSFEPADTFPLSFPVKLQQSFDAMEASDHFTPKWTQQQKFMLLDTLDEFENTTWSVNGATVHSLVGWFHNRFIGSSEASVVENRENEYPSRDMAYDAYKALSQDHPDISMLTLKAAVEEIERDGVVEWIPRLRTSEAEKFTDLNTPEIPQIPSQGIGPSFVILPNGRIDLGVSGDLPNEDLHEITTLCEELKSLISDLLSELSGTNAHTTLLGAIGSYELVLMNDKLSMDLLTARGIHLENTYFQLNNEIKSGEIPPLAPKVGASMQTALSLHGMIVTSTSRGRQLLERANRYAQDNFEAQEYKAKAQNLAAAIASADNFVDDNARDYIAVVNKEIDKGPHPERSTALSNAVNSNFLAKAAKLAVFGIVGSGLSNSIPGALAIGVITDAANAAWMFFASHNGLLREFAAVSGMDMSWMTSFLDWIERVRK